MTSHPTGTVTFLFTDVEGSTKLAQAHPAAWEAARRRHHAIVRDAVESHRGFVFQVIGDAFCASFTTAPDALAAALSAQRALQAEAWGETPIRVRMGLHTGAAEARDGDYHGYLTLAHVQRVMSTAYGGQTLISNATAGLLSGQLPDGVTLRDMGEHRLKGLLNPEHLWQVVAPDLPQDFPSLQSLNTIPNNLPIQVTSFVGREKEIAEVKQLLVGTDPHPRPALWRGLRYPLNAPKEIGAPGAGGFQNPWGLHTRLVTLTGSGGTGKTRLSLQVAAEVLDNFKDGIWYVELAPLADPALVPQTVANVLGLREEPGRPLMATLVDWLRPKQLLLILDNCEHLIDACARFADAVVHAGHELQILASSREALGIAGETAYRVPSLECPNPAQASHESAEQLTQYAAVQLFVERATQAQTKFTVTKANAPAVVQICYRLDGIPLAIELAAARVRGLSVEQIAARLDNMFQLLTGGSRTALPRQQTLRALIDWSYALLSEPEQRLLQRLSVFAGGWTLEAAEAVCGSQPSEASSQTSAASSQSSIASSQIAAASRASDLDTGDWILDTGDVLDLLLRLQDKSLIAILERQRHSRYRLLETVRQYARDKLLASGQSELVRDRHLQWYTRFAETVDPKLQSAERDTARLILEDELDNFRAALTWAFERQPEGALRLVAALPNIWLFGTQGYIHEGRALAERALALCETLLGLEGESSSGLLHAAASSPAWARVEAKILKTAGNLAILQGDYLVAQSRLQAAEHRARKAGDQTTLRDILLNQGLMKFFQGDHAQARALYEQCVVIDRQLGDAWHLAFSLWLLGDVIATDDPGSARKMYEGSLSLLRQTGDRYTASFPLTSLAHLASEEGKYAQARALLEEGLALRRKQVDKYMMSIALNSLAEVMCHQEDYESAAPLCEEAMILSRAVGDKSGIAWSQRNLADLAAGRGEVQRAEGLLRESLSLYRELGQKRDIVQVIESLAKIAVTEGRQEHATVLWGAANALRGSINAPRSHNLQSAYDRDVATARAQLGDASFDAAFAEGLRLTFEQAIAYALADPT